MFTLPDLPYDYSSLEPYIDEETMRLHHDKHHQAYVDNLNKALEGHQNLIDMPIEELLQNLGDVPENIRTKVRNNGGGHYNHSLFWQWMSPPSAGGGEPSGELLDAITHDFGSFEEFKQKFAESAAGRFGSGWVWLTRVDHKLVITDSPNQDSPIMEGVVPILGLDIWEHAYYLKYKNVRGDYVKAWWNVVNWNQVNQLFKDVTSQ